MDILKQEINQSNADVMSLAKWKIGVVSALVVVALGWIDTTSHWKITNSQAGQILLFSVGFICAYVDWLIYRRYTVIHTIAKYLREYDGEDDETNELKKYELRIKKTRRDGEFFLSERYNHFFSSVLMTVGAPFLLVLQKPFEFPGAVFILLLIGLVAVVVLFNEYDKRRYFLLSGRYPKHKICSRIYLELAGVRKQRKNKSA